MDDGCAIPGPSRPKRQTKTLPRLLFSGTVGVERKSTLCDRQWCALILLLGISFALFLCTPAVRLSLSPPHVIFPRGFQSGPVSKEVVFTSWTVLSSRFMPGSADLTVIFPSRGKDDIIFPYRMIVSSMMHSYRSSGQSVMRHATVDRFHPQAVFPYR